MVKHNNAFDKTEKKNLKRHKYPQTESFDFVDLKGILVI